MELLEHSQTMAAMGCDFPHPSRLPRVRDLSGELAAVGRVEADRCACLSDRIDKPIHKIFGTAVDDIFRPDALQDFDLRVAAHVVDQRNAVLRAKDRKSTRLNSSH